MNQFELDILELGIRVACYLQAEAEGFQILHGLHAERPWQRQETG